MCKFANKRGMAENKPEQDTMRHSFAVYLPDKGTDIRYIKDPGISIKKRQCGTCTYVKNN
jgi:hypothetical protein